jgi:hypothetical protein
MSFWQIHGGTSSLNWLMATNPNYNIIRILIALLLIGYVYLPDVQQFATRWVIRSIGIILLTVGCSGLLYLTYNDSRGLSMYPLDIISLIEGAILAVFVSITVPGELQDRQPGKARSSLSKTARKMADSVRNPSTENR